MDDFQPFVHVGEPETSGELLDEVLELLAQLVAELAQLHEHPLEVLLNPAGVLRQVELPDLVIPDALSERF